MAQSENLKPVKCTVKIHSVFFPAVKEIFVAADSADCQVYIGKVLEIDEDDTLILFMHHGNSKPLDSNSVLSW